MIEVKPGHGHKDILDGVDQTINMLVNTTLEE